MQSSAARTPASLANRGWYRFCLLAVAWTLVAGTTSLFAQVTVKTLGGGRTTPSGSDAGFVDGDTLQSSQFNAPSGAAVDAAGNLYIADLNNGAVRKLDVAGNRSSTLISGLDQPIAVATSGTNELYVLTRGDGLIRKLDRFGNISLSRARLFSPTALALDRNGAIFATEAGGNVMRIDPVTEAQILIKTGLRQPGGIAVLDSGLLAVSDTGNHRILFLDPDNGSTVLQVGLGIAGFRNGSTANALFNQPHHLAKAPNGSLLVVDRANHRVRAIGTDGAVTTVYGIDPNLWEGPECVTCAPIILPGWFDGPAEFAEAREPVGVAVSRDGKVYTTELFYHLVREVTVPGLTAGSGGGSGTANVVLPPRITPESGYYPLGQIVSVFNPNTNAFFSSAIYFTTDGSEPTTNSVRLQLSDNFGTIYWRETTRDLTSLRLKVFVGAIPSETAGGKPAAVNEIGVTRDISAGPGSTIVVPVVVNLRPNDQLKSLQFRVEISPQSTSVPMIPELFDALSISMNDFIPVVSSSGSGTNFFNVASYSTGSTRGLAITFISTNSNLSVKNFAVSAMLAVPIPPNAAIGSRYSIEILKPSGTSDGSETLIPLRSMAPRTITVAEVSYLAGDSSPAAWYNADRPGLSFGDGSLNNNDVNNAFAAALGARVPFPFTDLFDAMDVFPEDSSASAGGDGLIRFLDWQVILERSLGLDPARWVRTRSEGGVRTARSAAGAGLPNVPAQTLAGQSVNRAWHRQALVMSVPQENAQPGVSVKMPVYVSVAAGHRLAGLAFRAMLQSDSGAPSLEQPLQFLAAPGVRAPIQSGGATPNVLLCGWPLVPSPSFEPALQKTRLLGYVQFTIPSTARPGQTYTLRFANCDGSPDLHTQYDFETRPASVWVQTDALQKPEIISDEWKIYFFGGVAEELASANADPDHDGLNNLAEYMAGTNPQDARSRLQLETAAFDPIKKSFVLRWLTAPGKTYTVEASSNVLNSNWSAIVSGIPGDGGIQEWIQSEPGPSSRFYRLRVEPEFQTAPTPANVTAPAAGVRENLEFE